MGTDMSCFKSGRPSVTIAHISECGRSGSATDSCRLAVTVCRAKTAQKNELKHKKHKDKHNLSLCPLVKKSHWNCYCLLRSWKPITSYRYQQISKPALITQLPSNWHQFLLVFTNNSVAIWTFKPLETCRAKWLIILLVMKSQISKRQWSSPAV